jgi:phosphoglycolate phosphatase
MTPRAVFFDLDGCLVDSRAAISSCINHALQTLGLPPRPAAELHRYIGPRLRGAFVELLSASGGDAATVDAAVRAYREVYGEVSVRETRVVPGMPAVLEAVAGRARVAVVTSSPAAFARPVIEAVGLADVVEAVFAPGLDAHEETKSVALRAAMTSVGLSSPPPDPRLAVMVGDRYHDIEAGRECGIVTVAVTWGVGEREELRAATPDRVVSAPAELLDVLMG